MILSMQEIHEAIKDPNWQRFREDLKGIQTPDKLRRLAEYLEGVGAASIKENMEKYIQVQNYLNALARGGQIKPTNNQTSVRSQIKDAKVLK